MLCETCDNYHKVVFSDGREIHNCLINRIDLGAIIERKGYNDVPTVVKCTLYEKRYGRYVMADEAETNG